LNYLNSLGIQSIKEERSPLKCKNCQRKTNHLYQQNSIKNGSESFQLCKDCFLKQSLNNLGAKSTQLNSNDPGKNLTRTYREDFKNRTPQSISELNNPSNSRKEQRKSKSLVHQIEEMGKCPICTKTLKPRQTIIRHDCNQSYHSTCLACELLSRRNITNSFRCLTCSQIIPRDIFQINLNF